jgi:hypothetical protein
MIKMLCSRTARVARAEEVLLCSLRGGLPYRETAKFYAAVVDGLAANGLYGRRRCEDAYRCALSNLLKSDLVVMGKTMVDGIGQIDGGLERRYDVEVIRLTPLGATRAAQLS